MSSDLNAPLLAEEKITEYGVESSDLNNNNLSDSKSKSGSTYSPLAAYAFLINFILGVGVLGIPYAFFKAGIIFASILLVVVTAICYFTMLWIVEISARAEAITRVLHRLDKKEVNFDSGRLDDHIPDDVINENDVIEYDLTIYRKFEVTELCHMFLGKYGRIGYQICLSFYVIGITWGYASVFSSTIVALIPSSIFGLEDQCDMYADIIPGVCRVGYLVILSVFALVMITLVVKDVTELVALQIGLCIFSFFCMTFMAITVLIAMYTHPYEPEDYPDFPEGDDKPPYTASGTSLMNLSYLGLMFSTALFAQVAHHGVPTLAKPVKKKSTLKWVFAAALSSTALFYTLIGTIVALYFGPATQQIASLNWLNYDGPDNAPTIITWAVKYMIIMFPVADIVAAFPLHTIALGNNIFSILPATITENGTNTKIQKRCRIFAACPPIILAAFLWRLASILEFTGLFGFAVAYLIPATLQYSSTQFCVRKFGAERSKTPFTWEFSKTPYVQFIIVSMSIGLAFTFSEAIRSFTGGHD